MTKDIKVDLAKRDLNRALILLEKRYGSGRAAAKALGINQSDWIRIKNGRSRPYQNTLEKLGMRARYEFIDPAALLAPPQPTLELSASAP